MIHQLDCLLHHILHIYLLIVAKCDQCCKHSVSTVKPCNIMITPRCHAIKQLLITLPHQRCLCLDMLHRAVHTRSFLRTKHLMTNHADTISHQFNRLVILIQNLKAGTVNDDACLTSGI